MSEITVKLYHKDEVRRFSVTKNTDYKTFLEIVKGFFPKKFEENKTPSFTYEDEEGDKISFGTEMEWKEALKVDTKILRITIKTLISKVEKEKLLEEKKEEKEKERREMKEKVKSEKIQLRELQKQEKKESKTHNKYGFPIKNGDFIVEATPQQIDQFLKTGNIDLSCLGIDTESHVHFACDGCNAEGFKGNRYHCVACPDFDFCETCFKEKSKNHFGGSHIFSIVKKEIPFGKIETHIINEQPDKKEKGKKVEKKVEKKAEKKVEKVEKIEPPKVEEKKVEQPKVEQPKVEEKKVEEPKQIYPKIEIKNEQVQKDEKFNIHYKILENMGFKNVSLNTVLLTKHKGNLQRVVDELLLLQSQ